MFITWGFYVIQVVGEVWVMGTGLSLDQSMFFLAFSDVSELVSYCANWQTLKDSIEGKEREERCCDNIIISKTKIVIKR